MSSRIFATTAKAAAYLRAHHPEVKKLPQKCSGHAIVVGSVSEEIKKWDKGKGVRRCVYSVERSAWFRLRKGNGDSGALVLGDPIPKSELRNVQEKEEKKDGLITPEGFEELNTNKAKKVACYDLYEHFNAETIKYLQAVLDQDAARPDLVHLDHIEVSFQFAPAAKKGQRTTDMKIRPEDVSKVTKNVAKGHLLVIVVDLNGQKTSAGHVSEHPHSLLLLRTHNSSWALESNTNSSKTLEKVVYDHTHLAPLLHVPLDHFLLNRAQTASKMEICNAFTAIAAVMIMLNWQGDVAVLSKVNTFMDEVKTGTAKKLFVWLMRDYSL